MKKVLFKKIRNRREAFRNHPLTKDKVNLSVLRYLWCHLLLSIASKPLVFNWIGGLKFYLQKGSSGLLPNAYLELFDYHESHFLMDFLNENDLFIDVGANDGHFTLLAAGIAKARVIAFEPIPETYRILKTQIELNNLKLVELRNVGLGDKEGLRYFTLDKGTMNKAVTKEAPNTESLRISTLDVEIGDLSPKIIKLDVEGFEYHVLKGGCKTLKNETLKYLIVEINGSGLSFGVSNKELHEYIVSHGFTPVKYNGETKVLTSRSGYNSEGFNTIYQRLDHA